MASSCSRCRLPIPTFAILLLRGVEGGLHVTASTLLMARAAAAPHDRARSVALAGGALMVAIALGSAIGGMLMAIDPRAPFWFGAAISLGVAVAASRMAAPPPVAAKVEGRAAWLLRSTPGLLVPASAAFVSRFVIGCLVVTFSLFAHRAHGLSDRSIGVLYTFLTFPFALGTYPAGRLAERVPRSAVLCAGAVMIAVTTFGLRTASVGWLPAWMALMGVGCALVFAPTLAYATTLAPRGSSTRALALVNAASCLGMLLGPAAAGITCAIVGTGTVEAYRTVFAVASGSVVLWLLVTAPWTGRRLADELRATGEPAPARVSLRPAP